MIKRPGIVLVLLGILAAGGALWFLLLPSPAGVQPAELLPEETLVMIEAVDLKESLEEFRAGPLGRAILGIDIPACMRTFNAAPEAVEEVARLQERVTAGIDSPWFDTLFGDLAVVALLKPEPDAPAASPEEELRRSAVLLLRPKKPAETIQWIGKMFARDLAMTPHTEAGVRMDRIETGDGPPLFVAVHRGLGLVALDPKPIRRCLGPRPEGRRSLAESPRYAALRAELAAPEPSRGFVWIDLRPLLETGFAFAGEGDASAAEAEKVWSGFAQARPYIAAVATDDGRMIRHRWRVRYNTADLPPDLARMLTVPPERDAALPWVPEAVLYYSWQNNLGHLLESVLDLSRLDPAEADDFKGAFAAETGVRFEDALAAFGSQFAVMIRDIEAGGIFPVPQMALLVQVGKPEVMHRLLENLAQNYEIATATESYQGSTLRYLALPYGEQVSPGWAVRDGFLVAASSRGLLKTLLSRESDGKGLAASPDFSAVNGGMPDPGNQVVYLQTGKAAGRARELLKWALALAGMTGRAGDTAQMAYLADTVAAPILDGLSMYPAMGSRTVFREAGIHSETHILKPPRE